MLMTLVTGDWSGDGHEKSDRNTFNVNHTLIEVQEAYKASCRLTGVSFNNDQDDFTGVERDREDRKNYQIGTEYGDTRMSEQAYEILKEHIPGLDEFLNIYDEVRYIDDFDEIWWRFVKISLPDLVYTEYKTFIPDINIGGELNTQFGYGFYD